MKLITKDLSCGSSRCVWFGTKLLTSCEFECLAGRSSSKNWKVSIRFRGEPLLNFLKHFQTINGRKKWRFVAPVDLSVPSLITQSPSTISPVNLESEALLVRSQSADLPLGVGSVDSPALPDFSPASDASFTWGSMDSQSFCHTLEAIYQEVVHWRSNCFKIPYGNAGKRFVLELARLFQAAGEGSSLESIALKAVFTLCSLVLQKPARNSKNKDHISCLERRMNKWKDGDLNDLVLEGHTIQQRFTGKGRLRDQNSNSDRKAYSFAKLMFDGKTKPALDLLSGVCKGRRLGLNEIVDAVEDITVCEVLETKYPPAAPIHHECLIADDAPIPAHHSVIFETLDGSVICAAALQASGAAGPSGVDAYVWR